MGVTLAPGPGTSAKLHRVREAVERFATHSPSRSAILVFALLIAIFTALLSLPVASHNGEVTPLADAVFTAVSVVCVTGLSTVDMAVHWSTFGHVVIFIGVQIGGIGVLTTASLLGFVISRRMGLRAKLLAASDGNPLRAHPGPVAEGQAIRLNDIGGLLLTVVLSSVFIELVVAAIIFPRILMAGYPVVNALSDSIYYAAMAFTNTGFVPNAEGLAPFSHDVWFLGAIMVCVFLGSIGFPVIYALARNLKRRRHHRRGHWSLHVKLTLVTSALLIVGGTVLYLVLENDNSSTFGSMDAGQTVLQSAFLSTMTRSGGFSTLPIEDLNSSSLLVTDMLMFIGGGSASTAGGIKVTTLAVLFLAAFSEARGTQNINAFRRRIPQDVVHVAVSVVLWGATIVAVASIAIMSITHQALDYVLFEVISAFATCGLSTGLTEGAPEPAVYILAATMVLGRVGTVTLAAAVAQSQRKQLFQPPEERPIVG